MFLFLSRCLIFKVQSLTLSRGQLKEYITLFSLCQYFFESFLRFFQIFFLSAFLDLFRSLCFSLAESLYILSPRKLFVNTFYKLFCAFLTIFRSLYMRSRVFLCVPAYLTLYVVFISSFSLFYLDGVCIFHSLFVYLFLLLYACFLFMCTLPRSLH